MRLLFVNQFYHPDVAATAQMLTDLCEHLAARGHEVHVLCARGRYAPSPGDRAAVGPLPAREIHKGVHIHRVASSTFGKDVAYGRTLDYATFHLLTGLRVLFAGARYDAIVTLTTPPLIGVYATLVKLLTSAAHVCWVMDLHPDCEFALGMMDPRKLGPRLLGALNDMHLRRADACVVLGAHMAQRLAAKRIEAARVQVIPVWGQGSVADPARVLALREQLDLRERFVVMYAGNAGLVHSFDELCRSALFLCDSDKRFVFLFLGGGRGLERINLFAQQHQLDNMKVLPYVERDRLSDWLGLGDVHVVTLKAGMAGLAVPSKLYGIMAAGRPTVFVGPAACDTAETIRACDCGRVLANGDPDGLIAVLQQLTADAPLRDALGRNGRAAYERKYNAEICSEQWRALLERVTTKPVHTLPAGELVPENAD